MSDFNKRTHLLTKELDVDYHSAHRAVTMIISDCIANLSGPNPKFSWITSSWAKDSKGNEIDPIEADSEDLEKICQVCLTGAISYSAVTLESNLGVNPLDADALTAEYIWSILADEDDFYPNSSDIIQWNDALTENEGQTRVLKLLQRALDRLNEQETTNENA